MKETEEQSRRHQSRLWSEISIIQAHLEDIPFLLSLVTLGFCGKYIP